MTLVQYRPWGPLDWVLGHLPQSRWGMLASLSTEDRCVSTFAEVGKDRISSPRVLKILDPDLPQTKPFEERHNEIAARLRDLGCAHDCIKEVPLLATFDQMHGQLEEFLKECGDNVIFDITSMPKHWFFPSLKILLRRNAVRNLIVTYCSAETYAQTLSSNPNPLRALPGFATDDARTSHQTAIVGIGFEPLGLKELYFQHDIEKVRYIFPFPPGPPGFHRNWTFVRDLETSILNREAKEDDRWHIDMYDCSATFDALERLTQSARSTTVLAPYGPKTTSLAMCLFSIAAEVAKRPQVPVYYAQPKRYDIAYSTGIKAVDGKPDIKAYCLRLDGRDLYNLS